MTTHDITRRSFIQSAAAATVGVGVARSARLQAQGANDRIVLAVMGTNGRGAQLAKLLSQQPGAEVGYICDVEDKALARGSPPSRAGRPARREPRRTSGACSTTRTVDAVVIAAPNHWHAPATILACAAGKHVYVEKPCGHNPARGRAARGRRRRLQPRRPDGQPAAIVAERHGIAGSSARGAHRPRLLRARVVREHARPDRRGEAGPGPGGPRLPAVARARAAARSRDNLIHYNWHWFWHWGTSEACNNGTHEVDVMRWAMDVTFPVRVDSAGGRYHYKDDWECADTQVATFEFEGSNSIIWEGRSCNGFRTEGLERGVTFHGEQGSVLVDDNGYTVYDRKNKVVTKVDDVAEQSTTNTTGPGDRLDTYHLVNFLDCMRSRKPPNADIEEGHRSVTLCHLANIAYRVGHTIRCNPANGHILDDTQAQSLWSRSYEPGWEPEGLKAP